MKGFTLIETLMFTALVAALSLVGTGSMINFRTEATLDNISHELISEIRSARAKSMNGELLEGESTELFDPEGLPEYGIAVADNSYKLIRKCTKADLTTCENEPAIENINLESGYKLSPAVTFYFDRINGNFDEKTITLTDKSGNHKRQISIPANFIIRVIKI